MVMGQDQRVIVLLDSPILEIVPRRRRKNLEHLAFMQTPGVGFPVWWNLHPLRSGTVVGWAGGPAALALESDAGRISEIAVSSLADAFGCDRRTVRRHVLTTFRHDWSRDPFSRGAYSYASVGGA